MTDNLFNILAKPRKLKSEIRRLDERINDTRLMIMPSGIRYDTDKVISSPSDMMPEFASKLDELEKIRDGKKIEYIKARDYVFKLIDRLSDENMKDIIQQRYICLRKFSTILDNIPYEERQMYRIHREAIEELEKMIKDDSE